MADQAPAAELRAAATRLRDAVDPRAVARVIDGNYVAVCADHDEPALICKGCDWLDAGTEQLALLVAALLNARGPLQTWLEAMAWVCEREGLRPRGAFADWYGLNTARAISGRADG